jgi:hypothetical protein
VTDLFLVREEAVPVEQLQAGDRLILPNQRRVTVERVDFFHDVGFIVRWWRPADHGEPGHPGGKDKIANGRDAFDGRYLGSTVPAPAGHCWRVDRG